MTQPFPPDLFAKVMRLPEPARADILNLMSAATIEECQITEIVNKLIRQVEETSRRGKH